MRMHKLTPWKLAVRETQCQQERYEYVLHPTVSGTRHAFTRTPIPGNLSAIRMGSRPLSAGVTSPDNTQKSGNRERSTHTHTHRATGGKQETTVSDSRATEVAWQSRDTHSSLPSRFKKKKKKKSSPLQWRPSTVPSLPPPPYIPPRPPGSVLPGIVFRLDTKTMARGWTRSVPSLSERSSDLSNPLTCCSIFELSHRGQTE